MYEASILVTGGSGHLGSHCVARLLNEGYRVKTTVRSSDKESAAREMIQNAGADPRGASFVHADLSADDNWREAVRGCDYVLHVASPFTLGVPRDENEMIAPARDGTLRVLRAARDEGVSRVVMTSSFVAVAYGHRIPRGTTRMTFSEESWTRVDGDIDPYTKSKTLAEQAAWEFVAREGGGMELAVVNPVGIFGPALGTGVTPSLEIIRRLLNGSLPALPRMTITMVDVRDVVDLHIRAMTSSVAAGRRFIAASDEPIDLEEIAAVLKEHLGRDASRVPTRRMPDWVVRLIALLYSPFRGVARELGFSREASNGTARTMLGWTPRSNEETIVATAHSLIAHGSV